MYNDINEKSKGVELQSAFDVVLNAVESWFPAVGTKLRQIVRDIRMGKDGYDIADANKVIQQLLNRADTAEKQQALYDLQDELTQLKLSNSSSSNKNKVIRERIKELKSKNQKLSKQVTADNSVKDTMITNIEKYVSGEELLPVTRIKTERYIKENMK